MDHIELLTALEKNGLYKAVDVQKTITNNFDKPDRVLLINWGLEIDDAMRFISTLQDRKHIHIHWNLFEEPLYQGHETSQSYVWFDTYPLMASITIEGLDYLDRYRLNKATLAASRSTKWGFWTTLILSGITVWLSGLTFKETKSNSRELRVVEQRIDRLSVQTREIELRMLRQLNPITSSKDSFRTQPPSSEGNVQKTPFK